MINTIPFETPTEAVRWADFKWPRWVPENVRQQVRDFWSEDFGRSPKAWQTSFLYAYADHPMMGQRVKCESDNPKSKRTVIGRWVPMWNNIGRLVSRGGIVRVRSTCSIVNSQP